MLLYHAVAREIEKFLDRHDYEILDKYMDVKDEQSMTVEYVVQIDNVVRFIWCVVEEGELTGFPEKTPSRKKLEKKMIRWLAEHDTPDRWRITFDIIRGKVVAGSGLILKYETNVLSDAS